MWVSQLCYYIGHEQLRQNSDFLNDKSGVNIKAMTNVFDHKGAEKTNMTC